MTQRIKGSTEAYLIPGDPVRNVRLPRMFNAVFERFGIDAVLVPMQVPRRDFAVFFSVGFSRAQRARHGHRAAAHAAGGRPAGRLRSLRLCAGSVNVVRRTDDDQFEGDLFDGEGLIDALDHCNIPFRGKRVLMLGAGVSAAAVGVALDHSGTANGADHIAFHDTSAVKTAGVAARLDSFFFAATPRASCAKSSIRCRCRQTLRIRCATNLPTWPERSSEKRAS